MRDRDARLGSQAARGRRLDAPESSSDGSTARPHLLATCNPAGAPVSRGAGIVADTNLRDASPKMSLRLRLDRKGRRLPKSSGADRPDSRYRTPCITGLILETQMPLEPTRLAASRLPRACVPNGRPLAPQPCRLDVPRNPPRILSLPSPRAPDFQHAPPSLRNPASPASPTF